MPYLMLALLVLLVCSSIFVGIEQFGAILNRRIKKIKGVIWIQIEQLF